MNLTKIINDGCTINTSGTTGTPKAVYQSPDKIRYANQAAVRCQNIDSNSRIYTVCTLDHAGGLFAQTLPAVSVDAHVDIEQFNPYVWVRKVQEEVTHTHLTPNMARAIMATKTFQNGFDLTGLTVMCGSDRIHSSILEAFIEKGATFIANWGMSECGPVAINKTFNKGDLVDKYHESIMGDTIYCDTKIINNELHVKGNICVNNDWFATGDLVEYKDGIYWFLGRKL
jgi:acyl-CoA synthetase (AMP-forming)/AMP-acid ligase II